MKVLVVGERRARARAGRDPGCRAPWSPRCTRPLATPGISRIAETVDIPVDDLVSLRDYASRERDRPDRRRSRRPPDRGYLRGVLGGRPEGLRSLAGRRPYRGLEGLRQGAHAPRRRPHRPLRGVRPRGGGPRPTCAALSDYPIVVKADGAAAGKGVTVAHTQDEAEEAVRASFAGKFGAAGERIVIEEYLEGREASVFVVTDGQEILPFLPAQDYKRIYDGDEGPNTGGMGSYSPDHVDGAGHVRGHTGRHHTPHDPPARSDRGPLHGPPLRGRDGHRDGAEGAGVQLPLRGPGDAGHTAPHSAPTSSN